LLILKAEALVNQRDRIFWTQKRNLPLRAIALLVQVIVETGNLNPVKVAVPPSVSLEGIPHNRMERLLAGV
jgi:hypothetical protein